MHNKQTTMKDLELLHANASFEAVAVLQGASMAVSKLTQLTKSSIDFVTNKINSIKAYFNNSDTTNFDYYYTFAERWKYPDVRGIKLQVPMGFEGNFTEYVTALEKVFETHSTKLISEVIEPFDLYVSKLINNPALLTSQTFKHSIDTKDIDKARKDLAKFNKGKKHNEKTLGELYGNMSQLKEFASTLTDIVKLQTQYSLRDVKDATNKLNDNLNVLLDVLNNQPNTTTLSKRIIDDLSTLILELAKQIEFYAVVDHLIAQMIHCGLENTNALKRMIGVESIQYALPELTLSQETIIEYLTVGE